MPTPATELRGVVADLDGTLLLPDARLGEATTLALAALHLDGIPFMVATGRSVHGLDSLGDARHTVAAAICCSGAIGFDPGTGSILWQHLLEPAVITQAVEVLRRKVPEVGIAGFDGETWWVTESYHEVRGLWPTGPRRVVDADALAAAGVSAVVVVHPTRTSPELADILRTGGLDGEQATVTWAGPALLDIVPAGVDKGYGLRRACDLLGLLPEHVVAFGDGPNDLPLFSAAGLTVAVANAASTVLDTADLLAPSNEDEGVARMLAELGLVAPQAV